MQSTIISHNKKSTIRIAKEAGYTLIEMAIVMAIVGIFISSGLRALYIYNQHQAYKHDKVAMASITLALNGFLASNGRYPCPARYDDDRASATYGLETDCTDTSVAIGDCANGICIEQTQRIPAELAPGTRIRRGAIPFRVLNLLESDVYDGYGSKFSYALTEHLAELTTFNSAEGGITIVDEADFDVIEPDDSAHFVIFSHGENKVGGYSVLGSQDVPCAGGTFDVENCNTTVDDVAKYMSTFKSKAPGAYFDDTLTYRVAAEPPMWKKTNTTGLHITDLTDALGGVGGIQEPDDTSGTANAPKFDVDGDIRAQTDVQLNSICNESDGSCCAPDLITRTTAPALDCPGAGEFSTGVSNSALECETNIHNGCPSGTYMTGIDADRRPICGTLPLACGARSVTVCPGYTAYAGEQTYNLPPAFNGAYSTPYPLTGGANRREYWRCGSGGTWYRSWRQGSCSCTPATWSRTRSCGSGYTGTYTTEYTRVCPSGNTTSTQTANGCACAPRTSTQTRSCPTGFSGTQTRTRDWTCPSGPSGSGTWSSWSAWTGTCTCVPATQTSQLSCPTGFTGTGDYREKYFQCPAGVWDSNWTVITPASCTCTPTTQTRVVSCPPGQSGSITEERTSLCPGGNWGNWTQTANSCITITCSWSPATSSSSLTGPPGIGQRANAPCACGSPSEPCWEPAGLLTYKNYPSCACTSNL